jgi:DNA-binding response OmpR family regulator
MDYRILVTDTEAQITRTVCSYLEQEGLTPIIITDVPMVEAILRDQETHLVIIDIKSKKVDWQEVYRLVRLYSPAPFLLLVGYPGERIDKGMGLMHGGRGDYLMRPLNQAEFITTVRELLRQPKIL